MTPDPDYPHPFKLPDQVVRWDVVDGGILGALIRCPHCEGQSAICEVCSGRGELHRAYETPAGSRMDLHRHPDALAVFDRSNPFPVPADERPLPLGSPFTLRHVHADPRGAVGELGQRLEQWLGATGDRGTVAYLAGCVAAAALGAAIGTVSVAVDALRRRGTP